MVFRKIPTALKVCAVRLRLEGKRQSTVRRLLGDTMHNKSIGRWMRFYHLTRAVIRDPNTLLRCGRKRRLSEELREFIKELVLNQPHLFLSEIRAQLYDHSGQAVSLATIQLELQHRLQITLKKAGVGDYRKSLARKAEWVERMFKVPANCLVFTGQCLICCLASL